jgi:hypothetical protein
VTSAQINAQIFNIGPDFFTAVCHDLLAKATAADTPPQHVANQKRLQATCDAVINEAQIDLGLDHRALWQAIWPRIVYAGTLAAKATDEINSMRALVPMFQDLDHFSPERFVFDQLEWKAFSARWKARYKVKAHQDQWLKRSVDDPEWDPAAEFRQARTTPEVWKILTKDRETYPGLLFSAMPSKVEKYLEVATHLYQDRAGGNALPLNHYTGGQQFNAAHLIGQAWVLERKILNRVSARFEAQLGTLTALHTMMDMGLKTIKPDRVMTYLFSQLGWLQTLPDTDTQEEVIKRYMEKQVIQEMTVRADVLAASLDRAGLTNAHRRLDIWLVKFGQEPEKAFGITVNLQGQSSGIRSVLDRVLEASPHQGWITAEVAADNWPGDEFLPLRKHGEKAVRTKKKSTSSRISSGGVPNARVETYLMYPPIQRYLLDLTGRMKKESFQYIIKIEEKKRTPLEDILKRMLKTPPEDFSESKF